MRLRVLQLHNRYREPGGEDAVVRNESALLQARGHEVLVHEVINPSGARETAPLVLRAVGNSSSADEVRKLVEDFRPDVVHLHNWWFTLTPIVVDAVRAAGVPIVVTAHNHRLGCVDGTYYRDGAICTKCLGGSMWRAIPLACHRESHVSSAVLATTLQIHRRRGTWNRVDRWLALSSFQAELLVQSGLDADQITVKPNTTPDPGFRSQAPSQSRQVVFLGRLVREKGLDVLLEAWRAAAPDLELLVVGDGEVREELEPLAPEGVRFLGRQSPEEVARILAGARALLFPVQWLEPFGMVMVEAMAAGLPVAASDLGAVTDVLGEDAGWRTTDPSIEGWQQLLGVLDDDAEVDRRGAAGRQRYLDLFAPDRVIDVLEGVYRQVIDGR